MRVALAAGLLGLGMCTAACGPSAGARGVCQAPLFETQGHRGARAQRPEHTLEAHAYAVSRGVTTLEIDLAVTQDNILVLAHEPMLLGARCKDANGQPAADVAIRSLTLAQVRTFDCGSTPHPEFPNQVLQPGAPYATLAEVVTMADARTGGAIHYNLEPKMDPALDDLTPTPEEFMDLVERAVAALGIEDRTMIQSFDARPLRVLEERNSALRRSVLFVSDQAGIYGTILRGNPIETATFVGAQVVSPYGPITNRALIDAAHARGLAVIPWTINDEARMEELVGMGVDGLISDDVDTLTQVVERLKPTSGLCW